MFYMRVYHFVFLARYLKSETAAGDQCYAFKRLLKEMNN